MLISSPRLEFLVSPDSSKALVRIVGALRERVSKESIKGFDSKQLRHRSLKTFEDSEL